MITDVPNVLVPVRVPHYIIEKFHLNWDGRADSLYSDLLEAVGAYTLPDMNNAPEAIGHVVDEKYNYVLFYRRTGSDVLPYHAPKSKLYDQIAVDYYRSHIAILQERVEVLETSTRDFVRVICMAKQGSSAYEEAIKKMMVLLQIP